jgi:hypothetical protein
VQHASFSSGGYKTTMEDERNTAIHFCRRDRTFCDGTAAQNGNTKSAFSKVQVALQYKSTTQLSCAIANKLRLFNNHIFTIIVTLLEPCFWIYLRNSSLHTIRCGIALTYPNDILLDEGKTLTNTWEFNGGGDSVDFNAAIF